MGKEASSIAAKLPKVGLDRSKTGRAKGTPNKTTAILKDAIIQAATKAGGKGGLVAFLLMQANKENNAPFLALVGKVLPMQVTGEGDGPIKIVITGPDAGLL